MAADPVLDLGAEQRRELVVWFEANHDHLPESVRGFFGLHLPYLTAEGDLRRLVDTAVRELRRALRITPSSERLRPSGSPLAGQPRTDAGPGAAKKSMRERLEDAIARGKELAGWHRKLGKGHNAKVKRSEEKLANMPKAHDDDRANTEDTGVLRLEDITLTEEDLADAEAAGERFGEHLSAGDGVDPALTSVNETLMPGGVVLEQQECVDLPAVLPQELDGAEVVKTLSEQRVRYDFSVVVTRVELNVEKKVVVDREGERRVIAASTSQYGPPRYAVTWSALATLAILVAQFALPFNRLATMFSTPDKRFTAGAFARMLHYVGQRFVAVYLELGGQLADCRILAGDDTSCRVLEVSSYFAALKAGRITPGPAPPWAAYQTPTAANESLRRCEEAQKARLQRREDGDRNARRTPEETPSLAVLIGRELPFVSPRRNGEGDKQSLHTTVISGRSVEDDPSSLIVLYRSHLGGYGNLVEAILRRRKPELRELVLQGDLSTTNLVSSADLLSRFAIRLIGCSAHARRPFAICRDDDPVRCDAMLHWFLGLAIHERQLDIVGRNRENVLAVRGGDSREMWDSILELAKGMAKWWSQATKLGTAARYIVKHFDALTAYLDDPRLEPSNNLRERMLRMEKLIEGSSMFRRSLEGRFVLDVVRTVVQTAVAAGVPVHDYLLSVLCASEHDVAANPGHYTPRAWAAAHQCADTRLSAPPSSTPPT